MGLTSDRLPSSPMFILPQHSTDIADHQLLPPEETEGARHLAAMRALDRTFFASSSSTRI